MDERHTHIHYHNLNEREIIRAVEKILSPIMRKLDMISQEVQDVLDKAKQNNSLVGSVNDALTALGKQVSDLQAQINDLQTNHPLSDEDKSALVEASGDLASAITTLQTDIPANTPAAGGQPST